MRHEVFSLVEQASLPAGSITPLSPARLAAAKRAFATRRVDLDLAFGLLTGDQVRPRAGDLVLVEIDKIGHHKRIERVDGRRAALWPGDEAILAYGARYAPDQFEAVVPEDLSPCSMAAAGGIAGMVVSRSDKVRPATRVIPTGILADRTGKPLSTLDFGLPASDMPLNTRPHCVAVLGSSMNAGKTTTLAAMAHGASRQGKKVAALKVSGTGSGGDIWAYLDAGASFAWDFTDAGYPTTRGLPVETLEEITALLMGRAAAEGADLILLEVADGILFPETASLVQRPFFKHSIDAVVFAAADALGAVAGAEWLSARGLAPSIVGGAVTASPLAAAEAAAAQPAPVIGLEQLRRGEILAADLRAEAA